MLLFIFFQISVCHMVLSFWYDSVNLNFLFCVCFWSSWLAPQFLSYFFTVSLVRSYVHMYSRVTGVDCPTTENSCLSHTQHSMCLSSLSLQDGKRSSIWNNSFLNKNNGQSPETRYSWLFWKHYQLCVCVCVFVEFLKLEGVLQSSAYATQFTCAWNRVICYSCSTSLGADHEWVKDCR